MCVSFHGSPSKPYWHCWYGCKWLNGLVCCAKDKTNNIMSWASNSFVSRLTFGLVFDLSASIVRSLLLHRISVSVASILTRPPHSIQTTGRSRNHITKWVVDWIDEWKTSLSTMCMHRWNSMKWKLCWLITAQVFGLAYRNQYYWNGDEVHFEKHMKCVIITLSMSKLLVDDRLRSPWHLARWDTTENSYLIRTPSNLNNDCVNLEMKMEIIRVHYTWPRTEDS